MRRLDRVIHESVDALLQCPYDAEAARFLGDEARRLKHQNSLLFMIRESIRRYKA